MIKKHGSVTISNDGISITAFEIDCSGDDYPPGTDAAIQTQIDALEWAKGKIENNIKNLMKTHV